MPNLTGRHTRHVLLQDGDWAWTGQSRIVLLAAQLIFHPAGRCLDPHHAVDYIAKSVSNLRATGDRSSQLECVRRLNPEGYRLPHVRFTSALSRFFPDLRDESFAAETVSELVLAVEARHPGLADYLVDEQGALRKHVNVFVGSRMIRDRENLSDPLSDDVEVCIFQALSGG